MLFKIYCERKIYTMTPQDIPYPFYDISDENYFGEFRELSNSIEDFKKSDKKEAPINNKEKADDVFNDFSIFPID